MFSLSQPSERVVAERLAAASQLPVFTRQLLDIDRGLPPRARLPFGFAHDLSRSTLGHGPAVFVAARHAFTRWAIFDLGWVRVANPTAVITPGQIVAVQAQTLGLWSLNMSRIFAIADTPTRFGFLYSTTAIHVEEGEERFVLELDPATGEVFYLLEAISRPRNPLARLGLPFTRHFQHRFARDSHRRLRADATGRTSAIE